MVINVEMADCGSVGDRSPLKPGSHRKIVKDYMPKTGKDQGILSESG